MGAVELALALLAVGGYLVTGLLICIATFERSPFDIWMDGRSLVTHYLILLVWPAAVPLCVLLALRWWRAS